MTLILLVLEILGDDFDPHYISTRTSRGHFDPHCFSTRSITGPFDVIIYAQELLWVILTLILLVLEILGDDFDLHFIDNRITRG